MCATTCRQLALVLPLLILIAPSEARSQGMVFGPESFLRGPGSPTTERRIVDATGFTAPFRMVVSNGTQSGDGRISAATIWLDGVELLGPADFSHAALRYEVPVVLSETSMLEVSLAGEAQGSITIWIEEEPLRVVLDESRAVTELVRPDAGGVMTTTGSDGTVFSLQIPADALVEAQEITITPVAAMPDLPFSGGLLWGVHFAPEGLDLPGGATLTITPSFMPAPETLIPAGFRASSRDLFLHPMLIRGDDLLLPVSHFSGLVVGLGNDADVRDLLKNQLGNEEAQYVQRIADLLRGAAFELDNLPPGHEAALWTVLSDWYNSVVLPSLARAIEGSNSQCESFGSIYAAFRAFTSWLKTVETLNLGAVAPGPFVKSLDEMSAEWQARARSGVEGILMRCSEDCASLESFCDRSRSTTKLVALLKWLVILFPDIPDDVLSDLCGGHLQNMAIGIDVSPSQASLEIDDSVSLDVTVRTLAGAAVPRKGVHDISWSLSNAIVDVDPSGDSPPRSAVVTGVAEGSTEVVATLRECRQRDTFESRAQITVGPAQSVDVAFVVYNGAHNFDNFPPYGWNNYTNHTQDWYETFVSSFGDEFDLSLVNYNKSYCSDVSACAYPSKGCDQAQTVLPFGSSRLSRESDWQQAWQSLETVCDSDPWDLGSSLYSALLHTINNSQWSKDAAVKAIFVLPAASTCYYLYQGACEAENFTGRTLDEVVAAANREGVNLFVINPYAALPRDPYGGGNNGCSGYSCTSKVLYCYQWVAAKEEYQELAERTGGEYYRAYCDYPHYTDAVKQAIADVYGRANSSQ